MEGVWEHLMTCVGYRERRNVSWACSLCPTISGMYPVTDASGLWMGSIPLRARAPSLSCSQTRHGTQRNGGSREASQLRHSSIALVPSLGSERDESARVRRLP